MIYFLDLPTGIPMGNCYNYCLSSFHWWPHITSACYRLVPRARRNDLMVVTSVDTLIGKLETSIWSWLLFSRFSVPPIRRGTCIWKNWNSNGGSHHHFSRPYTGVMSTSDFLPRHFTSSNTRLHNVQIYLEIDTWFENPDGQQSAFCYILLVAALRGTHSTVTFSTKF